MLLNLPDTVEIVHDWNWDDIQPHIDALLAHDLTAETLDDWMNGWNGLMALMFENFALARLANDQDTSDEEAETYLKQLYASIFPRLIEANTQLSRKLVTSGLTPDNFALPLKKMETDIALFREENLPLNVREQALGMEYGKIVSRQTIEWDGEEKTLLEAQKLYQDNDRDTRERAWRLVMDRWLEDRDAINHVWQNLFDVRRQMAENAGFETYRAYRWQQFKRFDYTPDDCMTFHRAIEEVVLPAAQRANQRRQARLGVDTLRPWDLDVDPLGRAPLRPWEDIETFAATAETIFNQVDPTVGGYFQTMRQENLLDLPNRKNKGPGAYCTSLPHRQRPFIFMNAVGKRNDVRTLLHEAGHAFHNFETLKHLPYQQQRAYPIEFAEVASMAMELLAAPYLMEREGGYYTDADYKRDRVAHLEKILFFWPYMAVVDGFQHWAYTSGDTAQDPAACDAKWAELWDRFIQVDYTGLDDIRATGWHRKQHIYRYPFYYIEYGLAQLGAVQVWANALENQPQAVADYLDALALGGTRNLHDLYGAAGVKFAFDAETLGSAVELIESTIEQMDAS
jgi:oligoendopeptidase F